ncbi:sodium-influx-stimulating peptide [Elysia marginata]|uniref:Sodium-influx-stimulating peptide n=1 Tax=Elysia marginata TaxID=1093978 RepID=A0AAV4ITZ4_9GAST|nr:sodium-influx-stimulating peptide [Elysia marginata]
MAQSITWQFGVLLVFLAYFAIVSFAVETLGECLEDIRVDSVCYECAKRHLLPGAYEVLYTYCCTGNEEARVYCEAIYSEKPRAGGLWL